MAKVLDFIKRGLHSARPAAPSSDSVGLLYSSSDKGGGKVSRWDGTAWGDYSENPMYIATGAGVWYAAMGDGDPLKIFNILNSNGSAAVTPDNICTASFNRARCVLFRLPRTLALTDVQAFGGTTGSSGSMWKLAIYPAAGGAALWIGAAFDTATNDWAGITGITGVTLLADTDYYMCALATASSAIASMRCYQTLVGIGAHKASGPLDLAARGMATYREFTVAVAGTFDATLPSVAAITTTSGTAPIAALKGTAT